jgi:hypothetical protein
MRQLAACAPGRTILPDSRYSETSVYQVWRLLMSDVPADLVLGLKQPVRDAATKWWNQLATDDRAAIIAISSTEYDPAVAPRIFGGRFIPSDEALGWSDWFAAYFEHLVANPDQIYREPPHFRTFHIG